MKFEMPFLLWLLLLLPVGVALWRAADRSRARRASGYADPHLQAAVLSRGDHRASRWPTALQFGALGLLLFGAAQPVARPSMPVNKSSVMIAIDASRSMLADDVKPTRLEAAREIAREFVEDAPATTRIGLLTFSDNASVLVPPTTNREALLEALERVRPAQSTSFAQAVVSGVRALPGRESAVPPRELLELTTPPTTTTPIDRTALAPGAILLFSDGISNRGANPLLAARFAQDHAVKLYTVAVGNEGGAVTTVEGQLVFVPFDATTLERLAQLTEGKFMQSGDTEGLQSLTRELGSVIRWEPGDLPLGGPLSGLAALLLIVGGALALHWHRRIP